MIHLAGRKGKKKGNVLMRLHLHCNAVVRSVPKTRRVKKREADNGGQERSKGDKIIKVDGGCEL